MLCVQPSRILPYCLCNNMPILKELLVSRDIFLVSFCTYLAVKFNLLNIKNIMSFCNIQTVFKFSPIISEINFLSPIFN